MVMLTNPTRSNGHSNAVAQVIARTSMGPASCLIDISIGAVLFDICLGERAILAPRAEA